MGWYSSHAPGRVRSLSRPFHSFAVTTAKRFVMHAWTKEMPLDFPNGSECEAGSQALWVAKYPTHVFFLHELRHLQICQTNIPTGLTVEFRLTGMLRAVMTKPQGHVAFLWFSSNVIKEFRSSPKGLTQACGKNRPNARPFRCCDCLRVGTNELMAHLRILMCTGSQLRNSRPHPFSAPKFAKQTRGISPRAAGWEAV